MVLFGTRPEAIKLIPVVASLRAADVPVHVAVTAQHRALLDRVLDGAGITPETDLDIMQADQSLDALTVRLVEQIGATLDRVSPARLIVQGDTTTAMCGALAAYYRKIPVSHVEAGLRSQDIANPWPEEVNRRIVSTIADQHFAPTPRAASALCTEGINPGAIYITGNSGIDALHAARAEIASTGLRPIDTTINALGDRQIILVTMHRRESFGRAVKAIAIAVGRLAERSDVAVVFPVHPNPRVADVLRRSLDGHPNLHLVSPLDYLCFVRLLERCHLVLTDSGGVQEEASTLGKPVLIMRQTTERPEGIEAGTSKLVGTDTAAIIAAASELLDDPVAYAKMAKPGNQFGDGKAADRIAAVIKASL